MDGQTDEHKAICPFNFSKVGGIITHSYLEASFAIGSAIGVGQFIIPRGLSSTKPRVCTVIMASPILNCSSQSDGSFKAQ